MLSISPLNMEQFLNSVVEADNTSSLQVVGAMKTEMLSKVTESFASISATTNPLLHREAENEQVRRVLRGLTAARTYTTSAGHMSR